jgi:hypothetical protein
MLAGEVFINKTDNVALTMVTRQGKESESNERRLNKRECCRRAVKAGELGKQH